MKILILSIALSTASCSSNIKYKEVPYPVEKLVYCAGEVEVVKYETEKLRKNDPLPLKVKALLIERQQRIQVESQLRAELIGCQKPKD